MKTFLIFGKSSPKELKELSLKYKAEIVRLVKDFGGDVGSMYVILREKYMILISAFPGMKPADLSLQDNDELFRMKVEKPFDLPQACQRAKELSATLA